MSLVIKNIKVDWAWTGDSYSLRGFNVAITPQGKTPKENITVMSKVDLITSPFTYTFQSVTLDTTIQYTAWVQALYNGKDSDWISTSNMAVSDDGNSTIATTSYVSPTVTNFSQRNDRKSTTPATPTILLDGTAIDHTSNTDGSVDISFEWGFTAFNGSNGDDKDIDGFKIYIYASTSNTTYTFGTTPANEQVYIIPSDRRAFILQGVSANTFYTFGVQAYRDVDQDVNSSGRISSPIAKSTATGENPYQPSTTVAFAGNITGTISGTSASTVVTNASNGDSANTTVNSWKHSVGTTLIDGGKIYTGSITADKISVIARNNVYNFSNQGLATGVQVPLNWTLAGGTGGCSIDKTTQSITGVAGASARTIDCLVLTTDATKGHNLQLISDKFEIDPLKSYKMSIMVKSSSLSSKYVGLNVYNSSGVNIGCYTFTVSSKTISTTLDTNPYFWSISKSTTTSSNWVLVEGYVMASGTLASDIPYGANSYNHFIFPPDAKTMEIRFLNYNSSTAYGDGVTSTAYFYNPTVTTVDSGSIYADSIVGGKLTLGGNGNVNGTFSLKNNSGTDIVSMDNTGIVVNNANYRLAEQDGTQYLVNAGDNLILDHSFETIPYSINSFDNTYNDYAFAATNSWTIMNSPKYVNSYSSDLTKTGVIFGNWAAACTQFDYAEQMIKVKQSTTYTFSGYASSHRFRNTVGSPVNARLEVRGYTNAGALTYAPTPVVKQITTSHVSGSIDGTIRVAFTFTLPFNIDHVAVRVASDGGSQWVIWDGMQLVEGSYPALFETDGQLWSFLRGDIKAKYIESRQLVVFDPVSGKEGFLSIDNSSFLISGDMPLSTNHGVSINDTGNAYTEIRSVNGGTSFIDFAKNSSEDYNARIINESNQQLGIMGATGVTLRVAGSLTASSKSAVTTTPTYGELISYCDESPNHVFIDRGYECTDNEGLCTVLLDPMFLETVNTSTCDYWVQLTPFEEGDVKLRELKEKCFIVKGTPNTRFIWRVEAERFGYEKLRWNDAFMGAL